MTINVEKSNLEKYLNELKLISSMKKTIANSAEVWSYIGKGDWEAAGFLSEDEMKQFIIDNPYLNL